MLGADITKAKNMKTTQGRINAGWLRLWRTVYPDTPPPVEGRSENGGGRGQKAEGRGQRSEIRSQKTEGRRAAAPEYLSRFLCAWFALALLVSGCAGPKALKGGHAATTRKPGGLIEQTLAQGENASQSTRQDQEILIATNFGACYLAGVAGYARRYENTHKLERY